MREVNHIIPIYAKSVDFYEIKCYYVFITWQDAGKFFQILSVYTEMNPIAKIFWK